MVANALYKVLLYTFDNRTSCIITLTGILWQFSKNTVNEKITNDFVEVTLAIKVSNFCTFSARQTVW